MTEVFPAATSGNVAVSPGGPRDHVACDVEIARLRVRLTEVRETVTTFRTHYAGALGDQAADLACAVLQVIDKKPLERGEEERTQ